MSAPQVHKAARIRGKTLSLRNATVDDAAFILSLRTDEEKSRHLSKVSTDVEAQQRWLRGYEQRVDEAYFIIEDLQENSLGTVRLYDAQGDSFCWGSWILANGAPPAAAIESALMVYAYAVGSLGFYRAHFQVNKTNERVWKFHERFGAERTAEDDVQYEYTLSSFAIQSSMERYRRYLPRGIVVEEFPK